VSGPEDTEGSMHEDAEDSTSNGVTEDSTSNGVTEDSTSNGVTEDSPSSDVAGDSQRAGAAEHVEPATLEDLDRVLECWLALIEHGRQYGIHIETSPNRTIARETLAAAIAEDLAFVARVNGRVVGFCSLTVETGGFERDVDRGVIENLYVEPGMRSEGLGAALLAAGERRLVERGADVVAVETMVADETARSFYADRDYHPHRVTLEKRVETDR
jgi:GNAT superfamily N-acetyltransferase